MKQGTFPHFYQLMALRPIESQDSVFIFRTPLELRPNPIPPVVRRRNDGEHLEIFFAFKVKQGIFQLFFFQLQLMSIADMLILATAAFSEEPAKGLHSQGGFLFHGPRHCFHVIFLLPHDFDLNPVPGSRERDEDNFPVDPAHPAAAINHSFDFQGERTIHLLFTAENAENAENNIHKIYLLCCPHKCASY